MFESARLESGSHRKRRMLLIAILFALAVAFVWVFRMTEMPLKSYSGPLPALTQDQGQIADRLSSEEKYLSGTIGERSLNNPGSLKAATDYLRKHLEQAGYSVNDLHYQVQGEDVTNLEVILPGAESPKENVVVGAHYDSVAGTVGANDNASGVAATLELARLLHGSKPKKSVRFVFFVNEEPPYFQTQDMGSWQYARLLRQQGIQVAAMISLETIGFYSDASGSQKYPPVLNWFYPNRGNFIGFVSNPESRALVRRCIRRFRESASFPSEGVAAPSEWPGVGWSDHWSFWQEGYPAIMITDTAAFRYPYYHTTQDTYDKVNFEKAARVVDAVRGVVEMLAN